MFKNDKDIIKSYNKMVERICVNYNVYGSLEIS